MTYSLWDKISPVNGTEAIDIIGPEQTENDDEFILFFDGEEVVSIESVSTLRSIYGITEEGWEDAAAAYLAITATPSEPTVEERLADLESKTYINTDTLDVIIFDILPSIPG